MCIAIECSYKLDQKNEFKFLCELCTFSQIRSHLLTGSNFLKVLLTIKPSNLIPINYSAIQYIGHQGYTVTLLPVSYTL